MNNEPRADCPDDERQGDYDCLCGWEGSNRHDLDQHIRQHGAGVSDEQ
jgi:hypothetical protein